MEDIDITRQHIRSGAAVGAKLLQSAKVKELKFDDFGDPEGMLLFLHAADQV